MNSCLPSVGADVGQWSVFLELTGVSCRAGKTGNGCITSLLSQVSCRKTNFSVFSRKVIV